VAVGGGCAAVVSLNPSGARASAAARGGAAAWCVACASAGDRRSAWGGTAGAQGNPSNVGPIFHLTPSGGATCGSLNGKTILRAPYPKRRDGLCYMDHRMPSGRLNDRVYVGGSNEAPI